MYTLVQLSYTLIEHDVAVEQLVMRAVDARHPARCHGSSSVVAPRDDVPRRSGKSPRPGRLSAAPPRGDSSQTLSASASSSSVITSGTRTRMQFPCMPDLSRAGPLEAQRRRPRSRDPGAGSFVSRSRDELEGEHGAEAADIADRGKRSCQRIHAGADRVAESRARDRQGPPPRTDRGPRARRPGHRIPGEGAADRRVARRVHHLRHAQHAGERQAGGNRLGDGHQVGLDAVVLDREQLARCGRSRSAPRRRRGRCRARRRSGAARA